MNTTVATVTSCSIALVFFAGGWAEIQQQIARFLFDPLGRNMLYIRGTSSIFRHFQRYLPTLQVSEMVAEMEKMAGVPVQSGTGSMI